MSRKPSAQYKVLRAALRFGPAVATSKLVNATGLDANKVNAALVRARESGKVEIDSPAFSRVRQITLTEAGHQFLAEYEAGVLSVSVTKPSAAYQGDSKTRPCLRCRSEFRSTWPGHRVCNSCKDSRDWERGSSMDHYRVRMG